VAEAFGYAGTLSCPMLICAKDTVMIGDKIVSLVKRDGRIEPAQCNLCKGTGKFGTEPYPRCKGTGKLPSPAHDGRVSM
jgi:hypothetical protein